jgi:hypothetical protein
VIGTERAVRLAVSIAAAAVLSGGSAWALSGGLTNPSDSRSHSHAPATSTTESTSASTESTVIVDTTTSTANEDTTPSTTTAPPTTTPQAVDPTTTTTPALGTQACKPGWGYGDTNHCHSGPPGQNKTPDDPKHAHKHG